MATDETHRFRVKGFLVLVLLIATCGLMIASGHAPPDEEELATNTVINFAKALRSRSRDRMLPYLAGKAKAIVAQWPDVFGISNPHLGSFEILHITRLSDTTFEFIVRQYEEYTGYGIVGYYDITLLVEKIGNSYFISSMQWGDYVDLGRVTPIYRQR